MRSKKKDLILDVSKEEFLKLLPKLKKLSKKGINISLKYQDKVISNDLEKIEGLEEISQLLTALNIKDSKEKYEYIYDKVCDYLDNTFKKNNYCDFKDDRCAANRAGITKHYDNGCCYIKGVLCKHVQNRTCTKRCIADKLFTCRFLNRKGIKIKVNDILLLKYFFNRKQKEIIEYTFYTEKKEIIERLLKVR